MTLSGYRLIKPTEGKFGPVPHLQLPVSPGEVLLHRTFGQAEFVGDFLVGLGLPNQGYNLRLAA